MQSYADYLRSQGATEEQVTLFDVPLNRQAFEKMQAESVSEGRKAYKAEVDTWFNDTMNPTLDQLRKQALQSATEAAKYRGALEAAQKQGLINVAEDLGFKIDDPVPVAAAGPKYVTEEALASVASKYGRGIAMCDDLSREFGRLFPDAPPLNMTKTWDEAMALGKTVDAYMEEKYHMAAAREKKAAEVLKANEDRLRKEGADAAAREFAEKYGANPGTRIPAISHNTFTPKKEPSGGPFKPWEHSSSQLSDDRVNRVLQKRMERGDPN